MFFRLKTHIFIIILATFIFGVSNLDARTQNLRGRARTSFRSANVYLQQELFDRALEQYLNVLEEAPDHVESMKNIADLNFLFAENDGDEQKQYLETAHEYYVRTINTIHSISGWERYTNFDTILSDSQLKLRSIWVRIFKMGQDFFAEENFTDAERIFQELLVLAPDSVQTYQMLAAISDRQGDHEKAIEYSMKILEVNPENTQVLINIAVEFENTQNWERAKEFYQKFVKAEPSNPNGYLSVAFVEIQMNNFEAALTNYELAMQYAPDNIDIVANAASIAQRLEKDKKAITYFKKLVELERTAENVSVLCYTLAKVQNWTDLIAYAKIWYELAPNSTDAVDLIILGAYQSKNNTILKQYQDIRAKMK